MSFRVKVVLVLSIAAGLRITWGILVAVDPISDGHAYDVFALNIAQGIGYGWGEGRGALTAFWPVGTSALYAVFYKLFGHNYLPIVIFNILIGIGVVALSIHLARIWFDSRIALICGTFLAVWPILIQFTTVLASELYFTFLVLLYCAVWCAHQRRPVSNSVFLGVIYAAASYVRPTFLLVPLLVAIRDLITWSNIRNTAIRLVVALLVAGLLVAPWSYRNTKLFGEFALISTNSGAILWMSNNPNSDGEYMPLPDMGNVSEVERDRKLRQLAISHIVEHPGRFIMGTAMKLVKTYSRETIGVHWNVNGLRRLVSEAKIELLKWISTIYWWIVLGLALVGVVRYTVKESPIKTLTTYPLLIWGYFALVHSVTLAQDRYHFYCIPFIAMFSAYALNWVLPARGFSDET